MLNKLIQSSFLDEKCPNEFLIKWDITILIFPPLHFINSRNTLFNVFHFEYLCNRSDDLLITLRKLSNCVQYYLMIWNCIFYCVGDLSVWWHGRLSVLVSCPLELFVHLSVRLSQDYVSAFEDLFLLTGYVNQFYSDWVFQYQKELPHLWLT